MDGLDRGDYPLMGDELPLSPHIWQPWISRPSNIGQRFSVLEIYVLISPFKKIIFECSSMFNLQDMKHSKNIHIWPLTLEVSWRVTLNMSLLTFYLLLLSLLMYHSWCVTLDVLLLICDSWWVTLDVAVWMYHSWCFILDMSLLQCHSRHVTLDLSFWTCESWCVTLDV